MNKHEVHSAEHALAYITDCTLATVADMAMKKSKPVGEYNRQMSIAQQAIDWMDEMGISYQGTRAEEVSKAGSVTLWAQLLQR